MPRKGYIAKRDVLPDPIYNDKVVTKLINKIMLDGERSVAQSIVYRAFEVVGDKIGKEPLEVFHDAMNNVMPVLEVKADRRQTLGIRWISEYARERNGKNMVDKLAAEIMDAANNQGASVRKKEDTHRMAEANRAFAHYRW